MEFRSESPISMDVPSSIQALAQHKHVRCIVKLGGAAITCKNELERINEESLVVACSQLREAMNPETVESQGKVLGMDWSRRLGASIDSFADDFDVDSTLVSDSGFIIVHGAGLPILLYLKSDRRLVVKYVNGRFGLAFGGSERIKQVDYVGG